MKLHATMIGGATAFAVVAGFVASAARAGDPPAAPAYTAEGKMLFPKDYRTWIYLSTGLDMAYTKDAGNPNNHLFDSVFVNREAYDGFLKTGTWPDKTVMVLEVRHGQGRGSINERGQFQTDRAGAEVHVKDVARFKSTGGWAFFGNQGAQPMSMIPATESCYSCHQAHAAVDTTFVQFYPTLLPIAREKNTLAAAYLKDEAQLASAAR